MSIEGRKDNRSFNLPPTNVIPLGLSAPVVGDGTFTLSVEQKVSNNDIRKGILRSGGVLSTSTIISAGDGIVNTQAVYPIGISRTGSGIVADLSNSSGALATVIIKY